MRSPILVLLDANVLYSRLLREFFMELHLQDLIQARWTEDIHVEWTRSVLNDYPDINHTALTRTRELMDLHAEGSLVTGYHGLIEGLHLPDPEDRHVLAAAIHGEIPIIVSFNINDFPPSSLSSFDIEVRHPDAFLLSLFQAHSHDFLLSLRNVRIRMKNPSLNQRDFLSRLKSAGLPALVDQLIKTIEHL